MHMNTNKALLIIFIQKTKQNYTLCFVDNSHDEMSLRCVKLSTRACL